MRIPRTLGGVMGDAHDKCDCGHYFGVHMLCGACGYCACWRGQDEPHPDSTLGRAVRAERLRRQVMEGRPTVVGVERRDVDGEAS